MSNTRGVVFHNHALALLSKIPNAPVTHQSKIDLLVSEINTTTDPDIRHLANKLRIQDPEGAVVVYDALVYLSRDKGFKFQAGYLVDHVLETLTSQPTLNAHSELWSLALRVARKAISEEPRFKIPTEHVVLQRAYKAYGEGVHGAITFAKIVNPGHVVGDLDHILHRWG